jgi:hypothetical protein
MPARMRAPRGLPSGWLGARQPVGPLDEGAHSEGAASTRSRVAAYPLLPLQGESFDVTSADDIAPCVRRILTAVLPGIDWWVPEHWDGPFLKYGILHNSLPAPPNLMTSEAMAIEVYGKADNVIETGSEEWLIARRIARSNLTEVQGVRLSTRVVVHVATYANVRFPGWVCRSTCRLGRENPGTFVALTLVPLSPSGISMR